MTAETGAAERARVIAALTLIQVFFGVHYLAGKIVLAQIPPRAWAVLRVVGAALLLLALTRAMGRRFPRAPRDWALLAAYSERATRVMPEMVHKGARSLDLAPARASMFAWVREQAARLF